MNSKEIYLDDAIDIIEEVLASGGEFKMYPKGISMLPLIKAGRDSVVLKGDNGIELKKYDLAFYRRKTGQFVLHRVMRVEDNGTYTMCGDNQIYLEHDIEKDQIISKVVKLCRKEREVDFEGAGYRLYVFLWCCMPIRHFIKFPKRCVGWLCRKLKFSKTVD